MPILDNPRHEAFAQAVAQNKSAAESYRGAYEKASASTANTNGPALLRQAQVKLRVAELRTAIVAKQTQVQEEAAAIVAGKFAGQLLTMAERRAFLARVVRCDMTNLDTEKDGDLVQEIIINEQGTKMKLPGKRECILLDAELAGEIIDKHEVKDVTPRETMEELRSRVATARAKHG